MSQTPATDIAGNGPAHHEIFRDLVVGALSAGAAVLGGINHFSQGGRLHDDYGAEPGPALLPELLLSALAVVGVLLLLRGLLARRSAIPKAAVSPVAQGDGAAAQPGRAFATLGAVIGFALLQGGIGFGAAACMLAAVLTAALGAGEGRSLPRSAAEGVAVAAVLYAVFRYLLSVPLT